MDDLGDRQSMQDLMMALQRERDTLKKLIRDLQTRGKTKAATERQYRMAKKVLMEQERAKGTPVTIIGDIVMGDETIAKLKEERDNAEMMYEACQQAIYATKTEITIIMDLIKMEANIPT